MKYVVIGLSALNGLWMLIDGIYVLTNGKYIGPEKPGPWASLVGLTGIDVFKLGPMFVAFGISWLTLAGGLYWDAGWARMLGLILSVATLWYLPFGTLISFVVFIALMFVVKS
jgi:hypothetical protein